VVNGKTVEQSALYVAFVSAASDEAPAEQDLAEVWLDTSAAQNGTEVFCVLAGGNGQGERKWWYRSSLPPGPKEDGSPDLSLPINQMEAQVKGLEVRAGKGTWEGQRAWTLVFKIPLENLPQPLKATAREGSRFRINLLRNQWVARESKGRELLQANLSPVYQACQQASPYRMAELVLDGSSSPVAIRGGSAE
jgi:hypothetical protein